MPNEPHVSIVVVAYNSADWLPQCLSSLLASVGIRLTIHVVDNASSDDSVGCVQREFPSVEVIESPQNLGFAGAVNLGLRRAASDTVVLVNPDVTVGETTIAALAGALARDPTVAAAGGKLLSSDGTRLQHAGAFLSYPLALANHRGFGEEDQGQYEAEADVEYVTGALFALNRGLLGSIGDFDEGFYPAYFEEVDFCLRARRLGYRVIYVPSAIARHRGSVTTGLDTEQYYHFYHRNRLRLLLKQDADAKLCREVLPAELERQRGLAASGSTVELTALARAYEDNFAVLENRATFLVNPTAAAGLSGSPERSEFLQVLSANSHWLLATRDHRWEQIRENLAATRSAFRTSALDIDSDTLGSSNTLNRMRHAWKTLRRLWYLGPLMDRQDRSNRLFAEEIDRLGLAGRRTILGVQGLDRALSTLSLTVSKLETMMLERERTQVRLGRDLARVEQQLRHLESQLDLLEHARAFSASDPLG